MLTLTSFSCTPTAFIQETSSATLSPVSSPFLISSERDDAQVDEASKALARAKELGYTSKTSPRVKLLQCNTPELLPHVFELNTTTDLGEIYDVLDIADTPKDLWIVAFYPEKNSNVNVFLDTKTYEIVGILENVYISRQWVDKSPP